MSEFQVEIPWWVWDFIEDETANRVFWANGGLGAGKTHGFATWFLKRSFQNKRSPLSWAIAQTYGKVKNVLIPAFRESLEMDYGYRENRDFWVNISAPAALTFKSIRHTIEFHTGTRPDLMVGSNLSHYGITEVGLQTKEVFEKCETRARCPKASIIQGFCEGTYEQQQWHRELADFEGIREEQNARAVRLWTEDNPHLPPGYLAKLERLYGDDPAKLENYTRGAFNECIVGSVYTNYRPYTHRIENLEADPFRDIHLTLDFGANPMSWTALQQLPHPTYRSRKWIAVNEANEGHSQLDDTCIEFSRKFPQELFRDTQIVIYGDRSGHARSHKIRGSDYDHVRTYLRDLGYRNVSVRAAVSNPLQTDSAEALNKCFLHEVLFLCERCSKLDHSLKTTRWKDGVREIEKKSGETHTHPSDNLKYWAYAVGRHEIAREDLIMGY